MNCPNCGLANPDGAKFCSNCGTSFGNAPPPQSNPYQGQSQYQASAPYQASGPYQAPGATRSGGSVAKNIALGCLIVLAIFIFFGLSCTRACLGLRHGRGYMHRYY